MKKQSFKRVLAAVAAATMICAVPMAAMPVSAASTLTIKTDSTHGGTHVYTAYQIFKGDVSTETVGGKTVNVLSNIEWGDNIKDGTTDKSDDLVTALVNANNDSNSPLYNAGFASGMSASQIAEKIKSFGDNSPKAFEFARIVEGCVIGTAITLTQGTAATVAEGYYLVNDTASGVDNAAYSARILQVCGVTAIDPKIDYPTLSKNIVVAKDTNNQVFSKANAAAIGDVVDYRLITKVPDTKGYNKYFFVITDTLDKGLTFDASTVKIVLDTNGNDKIDSGEQVLTNGTDYSLTNTGSAGSDTVVKIVFKNVVSNQNLTPDTKMIIDYSASLNEYAGFETTNANPNKANLIYSNNPNVIYKGDNTNPDEPEKKQDGSPNEPVGKVPDQVVYTFTSDMKLNKTDGDSHTPLKDVEFTLSGTKLNKALLVKHTFATDVNGNYYKLKDGTYTSIAPNSTIADGLYDSTTQKYSYTEDKSTVLTAANNPLSFKGNTSEDGSLAFAGLTDGVYTLTETTPAGYNSIDPIKFRLSSSITESSGTYTCTWTMNKLDSNDQEIIPAISNNTFEIVNNKGATLPSTGGIGTTIFYVSGGALVLGAAVVLITRKRMSLKDDK